MTRSIDRRSSEGNGEVPEKSAFAEEQARVEKVIGVDRKPDGTIRRIEGTGFRSLSDFFDPSKSTIPMTRGDFTNMLALLYANEKETSLWGRVRRLFTGRKQVGSVRDQLVATHERAIAKWKEALEARVAEEAAKKAGLSVVK